MLFLLFRLEQDRYALEAREVVEVLPVVSWKVIPQAATGVLGVFDYHSEVVPLLDLAEFILKKPARLQMSTRIILLNYQSSIESSETHLLGVLAESATLTLQRSRDDFVEPGIGVGSAPYLGPVLTDSDGIIQLIEIQKLLPEEVREQLFHQPIPVE